MALRADFILRISSAWMDTSAAVPRTPPQGWWIITRAWGRANRFPLAPAARRTAPMEEACPMQ